MIEKILAGTVLAVCGLLLLRLLAGPGRRQRFDATVRRTWRMSRQHALDLWHGPARRRAAARAAEEVLRRAARKDAEQDGNVIRPRAFHDGRGPRNLH